MSASKPSRLSATIDLNKSGKHTGFVRVPHSVHRSAYGWLPIPIASVKNGKGPKVFLSAGNHGDEWEGQVALGKLIRSLSPKDIQGQVIICSSLNFPAANAGTRTSPIDDGNLNRSFPGNPDGTVTQQIAYYVEHVILPGCQYAFDFHSGGSSLMYLPSALCSRDPDPVKFERALERLRVFGAPYAYFSSKPQQTQGEDRTLGAGGHRQGVETMGTELGGTGKVTPSILRIAEQGILRLLAHVGVYKGQPAALIHFHDTPWRKPSIAHFEHDGVVLCMRIPGRTERGDCLFHLGSDYKPAAPAAAASKPGRKG